MGKSKTKYTPHSFAGTGMKLPDGRPDTFIMIHRSMLYSEAFLSLSGRQIALYLYCREKFFGARKPKHDYKSVHQFQDDEYFYMPMSEAVKTRKYTKNMRKEFYGDMKVLEEHGLIRTASHAKSSMHKNVYAFSDKWQTYTGQPEEKTETKD